MVGQTELGLHGFVEQCVCVARRTTAFQKSAPVVLQWGADDEESSHWNTAKRVWQNASAIAWNALRLKTWNEMQSGTSWSAVNGGWLDHARWRVKSRKRKKNSKFGHRIHPDWSCSTCPWTLSQDFRWTGQRSIVNSRNSWLLWANQIYLLEMHTLLLTLFHHILIYLIWQHPRFCSLNHVIKFTNINNRILYIYI